MLQKRNNTAYTDFVDEQNNLKSLFLAVSRDKDTNIWALLKFIL